MLTTRQILSAFVDACDRKKDFKWQAILRHKNEISLLNVLYVGQINPDSVVGFLGIKQREDLEYVWTADTFAGPDSDKNYELIKKWMNIHQTPVPGSGQKLEN